MKRGLGLPLLLLLASCAAVTQGPGTVGRQPNIRVLLDEGLRTVDVSSTAGLSVMTSSGLTLLESSRKGSVSASGHAPSLTLKLEPEGTVALAEDEALLVPAARSVLVYKGTEYDGSIKLVFVPDGTLTVLNVLPLEDYLEGVLPYEMGNPGPDGFDALKTQAVAARTYAYGKMEERKDGTFDVYATVMDQVYKGRRGKTREASAAIRETRGRILDAGGGQAAKCYYSACCGGHTSDIRLVWPDREPANYLHGIRDVDRVRTRAFCSEYKNFRWRYTFTGRQLGDVLRATIPRVLGVDEHDVGTVKNVRVVERSRSGRVTKLTIETTLREYTFTGDQIRWVLMVDVQRNRILPSVMFRLDKVMERDRIATISIAGGGNGHGVGMCQHGAIAMAKAGYRYDMILGHYYPGCTVAKLY